jgi:hypothetical protein
MYFLRLTLEIEDLFREFVSKPLCNRIGRPVLEDSNTNYRVPLVQHPEYWIKICSLTMEEDWITIA